MGTCREGGQVGEGVSAETERRVGRGHSGERLFTRGYLLACFTAFGSLAGFQFFLPTLPLYVKSLGGSDSDIGLLLAIFCTTAMISRPVAGAAADRWGRKRPLMASALLFLVATLLHNVATTVPSILLLRLLYGFGFGAVNTICSTLVADLAPSHRRGEAMGYFGLAGSVSTAVGSGAALWLLETPGLPLAGFPLLFAACGAIAFLELLTTLFVDETRRLPRGGVAARRPVSSFFYSRAAMPMASAMFFAAFAWGVLMGFAPIYLSTEDLGTVPIFFLVYAVAMALSRPMLGSLTDRVDRRVVVVPMLALCTVGVAILFISPSLPVALACAVLFATGYGALSPALMALVVDVVELRERGAGLGTFMVAVDLGIAVGSASLGLVAQAFGYRWVFPIAALVCAIGMVYFVLYMRRSPRRLPVPSEAPAPVPATADRSI